MRPDQLVGDAPARLLTFGSNVILATPDELRTKYKDKPPRNLVVVSDGTPDPVPGVLVIRSSELLPWVARKAVRLTFVPPGLKNVAAVIRGTTDDCVLVTAHYDHIGAKGSGDGDLIYNGANDNASGVAALLETARALSAKKVKPRRNIVFLAFFGEEAGLVGSRYYARKPLFALADTALQLNLEQLGRTDDSDGPRLASVTLTGFSYSNLPQMLATNTTRVKVVNPGKKADQYFERSDNEALAKLGVPAHTLSVSFEFPDYHEVSDHWEKLDYDNMALVTGFLADSVWSLASRADVPEWNAGNSAIAAYAKLRLATRPAISRAVSAPAGGSSPATRRPRLPAPSTRRSPGSGSIGTGRVNQKTSAVPASKRQ